MTPKDTFAAQVDAVLHQMATFQDGNAQLHTISLINEMADMLTHAREIAEALGERGWRPIETAPRDGSPFIAGRFTGEKRNHDGLMQTDRWHDRSRGDSYNGLGKFNHQFWPATHWMPLPTPPATIGADE